MRGGLDGPGLVIAVVEDDNAALVAAAAPGCDLLEGATLVLHLLPDVVVPRPFQASLLVGGHGLMLLHGEQPRLGLRLDEAGGEGTPSWLMTRAPPRVRRPSGVSRGSDLMGRSAGDPEEREPDDDEDAVFIRLGI